MIQVVSIVLWILLCLYILYLGAVKVIRHRVKFNDYLWMWLLAMWLAFANLIRC